MKWVVEMDRLEFRDKINFLKPDLTISTILNILLFFTN